MDQIRKAKSEGVAKSYEPSPHERAAIGAFSANGKKAPRAPRMKMSEKDGVRKIAPDHPEPAVAHILLMNALGTSDLDFLNGIVTQLGNAAKSTVNDLELNFMLAVVKGLKPTDQVEAMLAAQMAVTHTATMAFAHRLARAEHILELDCSEGALCKFARTFAAQVEALKRYRSRGERNVLIEDVRQLNGGGQSLVETPADNSSKSNGHHHAKRVTDVPQPAMRGPNAERETVPVTGDAKWPLPHARRNVARSTERK